MSTPSNATLRVGFGVAASSLVRFLSSGSLWVAWWTVPAISGLLLQRTFDSITGEAPATFGVAGLLAVLAGVEGLRLLMFFVAISTWGQWWSGAQALLRTNLLRAQVTSGGAEAGAPVRGAGTAVTVFRDDAEDVTQYVDTWVDLSGAVCFGVFALTVMLAVDPVITLVVVLPLLTVMVVNRVLAERIRRVRLADRTAAGRVTGFLGDVFSAVLAVKVAGAEDRAIRRLRELNGERRVTSVRDKVLTESLSAFNGSTVDVTIGIVLLLVASRMRSGTFTVGDLALFTAYLSWLAGLPRWVGMVLARHRHAQVSVRRMTALLPGRDPVEAVRPRSLQLLGPFEPAELPRAGAQPAASVRLRNFSVRADDGNGVTGIDLDLPAGSFTVITGKVGAGKSTLLRGLLGLEPAVTGTVEFNGAVVDDLGAHMVPPRCAYVGQVPRLFSATLRDNLTLGRETSPELLQRGLETAALDGDVAEMPHGLSTVVGPRGVRLSGGQLQRAATARALISEASLLVFDDLSSALDARTEQRLWQRLLAGHNNGAAVPTIVVVSHRAAALAHADQVVYLDGGRVVAVSSP
jgi:ATP-binding cassette subfamily B protein